MIKEAMNTIHINLLILCFDTIRDVTTEYSNLHIMNVEVTTAYFRE